MKAARAPSFGSSECDWIFLRIPDPPVGRPVGDAQGCMASWVSDSIYNPGA